MMFKLNVNLQHIASLLLAIMLCATTAHAAETEQFKSLVREASQDCRAAKSARRTDLVLANKHYESHLAKINQAAQLDNAAIATAPSEETQRVLDFCVGIKKDLDRAAALPLFEQGLKECSLARIALANGDFDQAREKRKLYDKNKTDALAMSGSVLDVHENSYEVRLCDRLGLDITEAVNNYKQQLNYTVKNDRDDFKPALDAFNQASSQCRGARNLINDKDNYTNGTVQQINKLVASADKTYDKAKAELAKLNAQGLALSAPQAERLEKLKKEYSGCVESIPAGLTKVEATVAEMVKTDPKFKLLDRDIRQIVGAPADYPKRAARRGTEGHVLVEFTVTKTGDTANIRVIEAEPAGVFDEAVIEAVSKYKYQPATNKSGQAIDTPGNQKRVVFKLQ
ncbi:MAG: energy transducer TonB [Gammaproteobacteria bacterium]|nr:energy transducer TonB [Gammaproteobacteria bacterium]